MQKVSIEELDTLAERLNDVTIAMYFANPDAFCKGIPSNGDSSRDLDTDDDNDTSEDELVQVEIDEDEVNLNNNNNNNQDTVVDNMQYSVIPLQQDRILGQKDICLSEMESNPTTTFEIPGSLIVQSVSTLETDQGLVRKIIVVRMPGSETQDATVLVKPPPATSSSARPALPPSSTGVSAGWEPSENTLRLREKQKGKPPLKYMAIIAQALLSSPTGHMEINSIYNYIMENYPYFRTTSLHWKNAIRHTLSVNDCFVKVGKVGSSRYFQWGIHPDCLAAFKAGKYSVKPEPVQPKVQVILDV